MGFYTHYLEGDMHIPAEQFSALQEALPRLMEEHQITDEDVQKHIQEMDAFAQRYERSYTYWPELPYEKKYLIRALDLIANEPARWHVGYQSEDDRLSIFFDEVKNWDWGWLVSIAQFIQSGTYVQVSDDDGEVYRVVAKNGQVGIHYPTWQM